MNIFLNLNGWVICGDKTYEHMWTIDFSMAVVDCDGWLVGIVVF